MIVNKKKFKNREKVSIEDKRYLKLQELEYRKNLKKYWK